jgi:hypothetical protein
MTNKIPATPFTPLHELALIGDRRSCALLDKQGNIVWYCPKRFDNPSLFAYLLDPAEGGAWTMEISDLAFEKRTYLEDSGILQTQFTGGKGNLLLEDWMPLDSPFNGICRKLSPSPVPYRMHLSPRPNYARELPVLEQKSDAHATVGFDLHFYSSHPLTVEQKSITGHVPAGEEAWFIFAEKALCHPQEAMEQARELTLKNWQEVASHIT